MFRASSRDSLNIIALNQVPETSPLRLWMNARKSSDPWFEPSERPHQERGKQAIQEFEEAFLGLNPSRKTSFSSVYNSPIRAKASISASQPTDNGDHQISGLRTVAREIYQALSPET
jgi:hypothetical protein